ncbi:type II secretion system F family protein [Lapillicoccus sp.]|uniref:type II secretion system F family protein n=1 Tax=Lapillicoccus sp. TaxID=1909287 RepID=UPI0025F23420|nr:type II secretion system F family protein [Lapillicoccus sp.]
MNTSADSLVVVEMVGLGALVGLGILLAVLGITPVPPKAAGASVLGPDLRRLATRIGRRIPIAVGVGLLMLLMTRWPVLAVAAALLVFFWNALVGGASSERNAYARLEGLAAWTESLRDTIAGAVGLEQAIPASAEAASPAIQKSVTDLADRLRVRVSLNTALNRLAADLDDPTADLVVAALLLNGKLRGPGLRDVLSSLARSVRSELEMRGRIMASRRSTRRSVQIVVGITAFAVLGLRLLNPGFVEPYGTVTGQAVLLFIVLIFAAGLLWLRRLSAFELPDRFLHLGTQEGATSSASSPTSPRRGRR